MPERRTDPGTRSNDVGATTSFELDSIQAARRLEDRPQPMFLVCGGVQRGRPIPVRAGTSTIGRGPVCDVSVQGRGISRTHLRVECSAEFAVTVSDAASTNGLFVNGKRVDRCTLAEGDLIQLGPETVLRFAFTPAYEMKLRVRQYENSIVDDLTGVHNRRYLMDSLEHELAFATRHAQPLCVMLLDIDHFKRVNDTWGHQAGDAVIKQLAERVADALRGEDIFARIGGEEFAVVTRGLDAEAATDAAARVRELVAARAFRFHDTEIACTVSIGGTMLVAGESPDVGTLLRRADENLYRAKRAGRDRVVVD